MLVCFCVFISFTATEGQRKEKVKLLWYVVNKKHALNRYTYVCDVVFLFSEEWGFLILNHVIMCAWDFCNARHFFKQG